MSNLAKVVITFTHNGETFNVNQIGSFSEKHFAELKAGGFVTDDPSDIAYGAQFGIKQANYDPVKSRPTDIGK
jgi:hypothetical protein